MSNLKDLFSGKISDKLLENSTEQELGSSVESADYLKSNIKDKNRFIPHVDFSTASNFAIYGSAEKYYEDAYNYILKEYPYDGSLKEKIDWSLSGTYLDRYIFENNYPRTTGYINFGQSYGSVIPLPSGYDSSGKDEWIYFKGHNVNYSLNSQTNSELTLQFDRLNLYNTASQGLSNLELEGSGGISTEFWLRKPSFDNTAESRRQVIVDIWNSGTFGEAGYGRFRVEISGTTTADALQPNFQVELLSGSGGFSSVTPSGEVPTVILSGSKLTGSSWNHFALTFVNTGSQMTGRLFTNGNLTYTYTGGTSIGTITGSMLGQIGSLIAPVSGGSEFQGYGKFSGSLDEFRFWKTRRTAKQIGQYWFTQVGGGTNTDITLAATASTKYSYENPTDLGVYYKFNEGIINTSSVNSKDKTVLDYAGRVTNGAWEGYTITSRNTGSAIVSASAASSEFLDPILYSTNPLVSTALDNKKNSGRFHDETNNSSIYGSLPEWITSDDQNKGNSALRNLTQIMASYFDTLYLQTQAIPGLKNKEYISGSNKPFPFVNRFIDASGFLTSEIFSKATDLEYLDARNNTKKFTDKINELKNLIYKNIYNNLVYIYKTKGTEKSFRNLIRSFGVDKELINIRLYGDEVTYKLQDNYDNSTIRKRYADFYSEDLVNAVVYQQTASGNSYSRGYISSSREVQYRGNTYELESFFPKDVEKGTSVYFNAAFQTASIFGCHTSGSPGTTWGIYPSAGDSGQFQVQSVRPDIRRKAAFFQLTCSNDGLGVMPKLTSSVFQDVYDGTRWNFAVRIKPKKYPLAAGVDGSDVGQYDVEFSGYNYVLDILNDSFMVTSSITAANAQNFLKANKRFFIGAHRTNTTGAVLQQSNIKATSLRVWMDYLTSSVLQAHAKDVTNFGSLNPYRDAYITELGTSLGSKDVKAIPQLETLILNWDFDTLTGSDATGNFIVQDASIASSGSNDYTGRWGWLGSIGQYQHTGYGYGFPVNSTGSIDRRYVHTLELQPPETLNSSDMVSLIDEEQNQLFSKDTRPESYFFAFEKSMYNIISKEILDIFATIVDFNNLIGEPVNRYRQDYKNMQKLRQLYFERVQNTLELNKFVEYFKWLDSAISIMLQQLVPGSAKFSENLRTMIESHVLERNKYWTKFPTLEMKASDPEAGLFGINELLYSAKRGLAPIPETATGSNCEWWHDRANRNNPSITSDDSTIDTQRDTFRSADDFKSGSGPTLAVSRKTTATTTTYEGQAYALRNFTKLYKLTVDESPEIHGGSNFARGKSVEYTHEALEYGSSKQLSIAASSIPAEKSCDDVIIPDSKKMLEAKVENNTDPFGYTSGKSEIFAPFSLFSSSVTNGYIANVLTNFRAKTEINNYHDDIYGDDKGIPIQGPFTERHVGGRQHRHLNINTSSATTTLNRAEAWNLNLDKLSTKSIAFEDSNSEYLDITSDDGTTSSDFGGTGAWTAAIWFKTTKCISYQIPFARAATATADTDWLLILGYGSGAYSTGVQMVDGAGSITQATAVAQDFCDGEWHLFVGGWDGSTLFCDIDGGAFRTTTSVASRRGTCANVTGNRVSIGTSAKSGLTVYEFAGNLDEASFWSKGLSAAECATLYNAGCPTNIGSESGLVSWWRMGEAVGDSTDSGDASARIYDVVGGHNGTPINLVSSDIENNGTDFNTCPNNSITITPRTTHQPRAIYIRDEYAKRPVNIKNIEWGTASAVVGNYQNCYEILQTTGRTSNNRFFVKNEGFAPSIFPSTYLTGIMDFTLPRYDLTGSTTCIFVNRFSAPGGPEVNSRGSLDIYAEEFSPYNELNNRNLTVRNALNGWQTDHCGQFGIVSVSGTIQEYRQPRWQNYDTLASYHKTPRNGAHRGFYNSGYDREVEWIPRREVILSNYNRTVTSDTSTDWTSYAISNQKLETSGYFEIEVSDIAAPNNEWAVGISSNDYKTDGTTFWDFSLYHNITAGRCYVYEGDSVGTHFVIAVGDKLRILRDKGRVVFQHLPTGKTNWIDKETATNTATGSYYPRVAFKGNGSPSIINARISNPRYDNWFVQHPIPQSDLQYAWINDSYDATKDQPLGYTGGSHDNDGLVPYTVPSGTTSTTASAVQFVTGTSLWISEPDSSVTHTTPVAFNGMFTIRGVDYDGYNQNYVNQITSSTNTISPGYNFVNTLVSKDIPYYFLNLNGPYQYPSWKQIRTGETPVARYHKRNNILSVQTPPSLVELPNPLGSGISKVWITRKDSFKNFVEPPVTFKYRPLTSHLGNDALPHLQQHVVSLRHSYGNNKCLWTQRGLPLDDPSAKSIAGYLGYLNYKTGTQIYDKLRQSNEYQLTLMNMIYPEVVYPRGANTGLARTRARLAYAETASVNAEFPPSASLSLGSNGIDRGPNERRTFWRDLNYNRNRYGEYTGGENCGEGPCYKNTNFTTTISNSCGNQDGHARSVWCYGKEPLVWYPASASMPACSLRLSNSSGFAENLGQDTGELNSINILKIGGLMGGIISGGLCNLNSFYTAPSASAYYYWLPYMGLGQQYWRWKRETYGALGSAVSGTYTVELCKGLKWTTAIDSGKNPWFDSYEEYEEDIRGLSKAWTVLPEFRISDNMEYYIKTKGDNFQAKNDKFLLLNGGNITQSADVGDASPSEPNARNFDKDFFKEYSFSDFQKYLGTFSENNTLKQITLKCTGVKKLLPYKGFYPADRTTQLVSLFSGALGQYVTGGALSASNLGGGGPMVPGDADVNISEKVEKQLALQSLLQPWFAPGILYNTIKSGIAVDWPIFTGSVSGSSWGGLSSGLEFKISGSVSKRLPFKSLLNPLEFVPTSRSAGGHELMFLAPSYTQPGNWILRKDTDVRPRYPYAEFRNPRPQNSVMDLYSSAMHNYLAEIPNFFLNGSGLKSLESLPQSQLPIEEGKIYVMDVYLDKTNTPNNQLIMMEDYYNGYVSGTADQIMTTYLPSPLITASFNGKYFGPPFVVTEDGSDDNRASNAYGGGAFPTTTMCDPTYAPCTPPYFYGKAKVRLIYTGSLNDRGDGGAAFWDLTKILAHMTMSFKSHDDPRREAWTKYEPFEEYQRLGGNNGRNFERAPAYAAMMDVTASLNLLGIKVDLNAPLETGQNRWVIAPFMETPVLDFSSSQTPVQGYGRGMWSGYGENPVEKGIFFGLENSTTDEEFRRRRLELDSTQQVGDMTTWFQNVPEDTDPSKYNPQFSLTRKVGDIAPNKLISEAVVAIPFYPRRVRKGTLNVARTINTPIMGKYFFSLGKSKADARQNFNQQRQNLLQTGQAIPYPSSLANKYGFVSPQQAANSTSISDLSVGAEIDGAPGTYKRGLMEKYILPPELDFLKNSEIDPFVMYIMEFTHELSQQDLIDIWQGVMPKISTTAELGVSSIKHPMNPGEFFGGKKLPSSEDLRWMVFKVKRRASINYWSMTPSTTDDSGFTGNPQDINPIGLDYSYNWPYDYFSLVELAQVETVSSFVEGINPVAENAIVAEDEAAEAEENDETAGEGPEQNYRNDAGTGDSEGASGTDVDRSAGARARSATFGTRSGGEPRTSPVRGVRGGAGRGGTGGGYS